jgi:hypothetical protein
VAALGQDVDPSDDGRYAWAENAGWIDAAPAGCGECGVQVDDFELSGWAWGENIGWVSLSCDNTASCATADYGVANDGTGALSGFAYAENVGWLSFSCDTTSSCATADYGVSIDPDTGKFTGFAWGENIGWVNFSCENRDTCGSVDFGVLTDWCQAIAGVPWDTPFVSIVGAGSNTELSWAPSGGAGWYEVTRGDLMLLRAGDGDYAAATDQCAADNQTMTSIPIAAHPGAGEGFWYLVRGVNCKGKGSYDSTGPSQPGSRDAGIAGSGSDCS